MDEDHLELQKSKKIFSNHVIGTGDQGNEDLALYIKQLLAIQISDMMLKSAQ